MLTLLFIFLAFCVFGKLIWLAFRLTFGLLELALSFLFLPLVLIGMVAGGLINFAIPLLIIVGIIALLTPAR